MYQFIDRLHTLYGLLQDNQSKEIFQARFALDMECSIHSVRHLASLGTHRDSDMPFLGWPEPHKGILKKLNQEHKKIILYGTSGKGRFFATLLQWEGIEFYGFCGRKAERYPFGLMGKPVLSPDELVAHGDEYYVVLTVNKKSSYTEISKFLREHNYPEEHILDWVDQASLQEESYFEFPEFYHRGTAFIDGGCYDCETSRIFAKWCGGEYSSIIAFEPDPDNYARCCKKMQDDPLPNFQLINAGLSSQEGTAVFDAGNRSESYMVVDLPTVAFSSPCDQNGNKISIRTVAIDDIIGDRTVGFIKMDIEGAEFNALHGARNTIVRDKPLLAICVYHLRGDLFAIMDYLHQLLPEYRFLLRHYSYDGAETVLYASIDL